MNKTIIAAVAVLLSAGAAQAADLGHSMKDMPLPAVFVPSWEGLYLGGHAGFGVGQAENTYDNYIYDFDPLVADYVFLNTAKQNSDFNGPLFGAHLGYNFQRGAFVFGLEAAFDGSNMEGNKSYNETIYEVFDVDMDGQRTTDEGDLQHKLNWVTTAVARLGYASGNTMFYGFGGAAWANVKTKWDGVQTDCTYVAGALDACVSDPYSGNDSSKHLGWTAGLGLEYAINDRFSARVEYAHVDLGNEKIFADTEKVDISFDTIKIGASMKLTGRREVIEPLK